METTNTSTFKHMRDGLQQGIYTVINPFVRLLIRMGVTPNMVTTIGMLGNMAAAAVMVWAAIKISQYGMAPDYGLVTLAGALIIGFSLFDMLDGQVARLGNMASTYGAMYDSVLRPILRTIYTWRHSGIPNRVRQYMGRRNYVPCPCRQHHWSAMCAPAPRA